MTRLPAALALATSLALLCAPAAAQTIPPPETPVSTTSAPSVWSMRVEMLALCAAGITSTLAGAVSRQKG